MKLNTNPVSGAREGREQIHVYPNRLTCNFYFGVFKGDSKLPTTRMKQKVTK